MSKTTPHYLRDYWNSIKGKQSVIRISKTAEEKFNIYPNTVWFNDGNFEFIIPSWCGIYANNNITCDSFEKVLLLCKASFMGDKKSFLRILDSKTSTLWNYYAMDITVDDKDKWLERVCDIVLEIVDAKYAASSKLSKNLLDSDKKLIVYSCEFDFILGNGFDIYNPYNSHPSLWFGSNVLGWAIMSVREKIRTNPDKYIKEEPFWEAFLPCVSLGSDREYI